MFMFRERVSRAARTRRAQSPTPTAGGTSSLSPACSLTALSIALRLVVARGWTTTTPPAAGIGSSWHDGSACKIAGGARASCGYIGVRSGRGTRSSPLLGNPFVRNFDAGHVWFSRKGGVSAEGTSIRARSSPAEYTGTATDVTGAAVDSGKASASHRTSYGSPATKLARLSKLLADRAVGTRSEVEAMVRQGRIKVEGSVVRSPKVKLPVDCVIEVNGEPCGPLPLLVAFHKPKGVITTLSDDWDREDLSSALPKSLLLKHHPVGRLDGDSSGLLLLSSDGTLTHKLLNPRFCVEREYVATVEVPPLEEEPGYALVEALKEGVKTADGVYKADVPGIEGRDVRIVVREGKNRMVRRMLANAGYPVLELRRERYGKILLGDLPEGEHQPVIGDELEWARSFLEGKAAHGGGDGGGRGDTNP